MVIWGSTQPIVCPTERVECRHEPIENRELSNVRSVSLKLESVTTSRGTLFAEDVAASMVPFRVFRVNFTSLNTRRSSILSRRLNLHIVHVVIGSSSKPIPCRKPEKFVLYSFDFKLLFSGVRVPNHCGIFEIAVDERVVESDLRERVFEVFSYSHDETQYSSRLAANSVNVLVESEFEIVDYAQVSYHIYSLQWHRVDSVREILLVKLIT